MPASRRPLTPFAPFVPALTALSLTVSAATAARAVEPGPGPLDTLQREVDAQGARLDALRRALAEEADRFEALRRQLAAARVDAVAPAPTATVPPTPPAPPTTASGPAPDTAAAVAAVAQIFDQPGVLTPAGHGVIEPALQYSYSSSNRIALVGYTVIPAILVGLIDIREVKRNTLNATLTGRWGLSNRFELEARVPYSYRSDTSIGRQLGDGAASDSVFAASGRGLGDVELTGRYQFNDAVAGEPIWVGSLRFKSRTGRDPFQVVTDSSIAGLRDGVQTSLPTGSGFYGLQPALTGLFASDPAVFFGTVSYLHNLERRDVVRQTTTGPEAIGSIAPGDVIGFNFGMGLGLNERSSFSLGYDHASVGRARVNGTPVAESVRVQLGTLLLGYSYRLSADRSLAVSLGAGVTRDTPDVTLTVRLPINF